MTTTMITSVDPTTGASVENVVETSTASQVDASCAAAAAAFDDLRNADRTLRSTLLRAIAEQLESRRTEIVDLGVRETALPEQRLHGELTRTVYQARLFAEVVDEGGYLEATIDHAGDTPMGSGPDLRRMLVPTGPVAVFGASNFPLAFSVAGGDTVAALAAGCPVVIKAHDSHPALSQLTFRAMAEAVSACGAPAGTVGLVWGLEAGAQLVQHPAITAVAFTGSQRGGQALMDLIAGRDTPIPFYGELSSLNPVVITAGAAQARGEDLAAGLVTATTGSGGQLCTKPGLVLVPDGPTGDALVGTAGRLIDGTPAVTLLNEGICNAYGTIGDILLEQPGVSLLAEGQHADNDGFTVSARLLGLDASELASGAIEECFGPTTMIVRYTDDTLESALTRLPGSLTATVHAEPDEDITDLVAALQPKAGRLLFDGWPTGVLVSWAQHHGGPWPATNTQHTSVGTTSIRRFLRPLTWQSAPASVLPVELRETHTAIPRRIDGVLVPAESESNR